MELQSLMTNTVLWTNNYNTQQQQQKQQQQQQQQRHHQQQKSKHNYISNTKHVPNCTLCIRHHCIVSNAKESAQL